ncbi:DUF6455 family protein [Jannaschia pohangensis]|uniref:DUF6455 domain-containing protein n=1 Tax=Jannaschia pohangensis TaxID=390807 RepID=A0A1I3M204_9RHOB|nr:DUF6455 family protein [Jannaschia pohangensis]SFI91032.1 hypothetical protein SAMN04488095_1706 [Jannaschia pohangensis]
MTNRPHPLGDVRLHLNLMRDMAKATGTDTETAFSEGRLHHAEWADALTRCRNCRSAEACRHWLDEYEALPRVIPEACENHAFFTDIQAAQLTR